MSFETLLLLAIFIVLPLLERLMKMLREQQGRRSSQPSADVSGPTRAEPSAPSSPPPRPPRERRPGPRPLPGARPQPRGPAGRPPTRRPAVAMPAEAQSLEAAALSRMEAQPIADVPIDVPIAPAPQPPVRRARPRIDLRRPESLRAAVIAHTVIGPCRAAQPYQAGPDV